MACSCGWSDCSGGCHSQSPQDPQQKTDHGLSELLATVADCEEWEQRINTWRYVR